MNSVTKYRGLTLVEVIVVILITGLLALISFPVITNSVDAAKRSSCTTWSAPNKVGHW